MLVLSVKTSAGLSPVGYGNPWACSKVSFPALIVVDQGSKGQPVLVWQSDKVGPLSNGLIGVTADERIRSHAKGGSGVSQVEAHIPARRRAQGIPQIGEPPLPSRLPNAVEYKRVPLQSRERVHETQVL